MKSKAESANRPGRELARHHPAKRGGGFAGSVVEINYFQDEDGMFTAEVPAIRGCVAWGKTILEAYHNAVDAIESCLEAREKIGAKKPRKPRYAGVNIYRRPVHA